jgi:cell division protein FtsQ
MSLDSTLRATPSARRRAARRRLPHPSPRLVATIVAAALVLAGGWLWLRDAALVEVRDVRVSGSTSSERDRIRAALELAARDMTTLHVREDALNAAVAPYASVAGLRVRTDFPHGMAIEVIEHRPVAALESGGRRIPAAGSGLVLQGVVAAPDLPTIRVELAPAGERVTDRGTLAALAIAAAAPEPLDRRIDRIWNGPDGLVLTLREGPDLIFGNQRDAARKWASAARVLAEPSAVGATYLDVRLPERVGAGGLGPVSEEEPAEAGATTPTATPTPNPQP